jgi:transcriptional regulator with XRE-family HTH domain
MAKSLRIRVSDWIRDIIEEKGLKQHEFAEKAGLSKSYLNRILAGNINVTVDVIERIEKAAKAELFHKPKK